MITLLRSGLSGSPRVISLVSVMGTVGGVRGIVREVQGGHGICYRVQHLDLDSDGWYEPDELKAGSCPRNLWDHLAEG